MDANIINNRNITISRLLNEDISIKSRDIKILNIFFDKNNLSIEEDYPNLNLYNLKLESPFIIN
ncbi:MAG: hypothetical protein ACRC3Y_15360, partial [Romboutsia sp.]|uniref:hypothetical protein n=1 Tax=Romboutsia sp. TaxID=1965302 RepID=UPI003F3A93C4